MKQWCHHLAICVFFFLSGEALAQETGFKQGDLLLRGRLAVVAPREKADIQPTGGNLYLNDAVTPEIDLTYFVDDRIAIEVIPGLITHKVKVKGSRMGDKNLDRVWAIAPTIVVQYHQPLTDSVKPYIGAGMSYVTYIADSDTDISYEDDIAALVQAGIDIALDSKKKWHANLDIKKAWSGTKSKMMSGRIKGDIHTDPVITSVGIGYRF